MDNDPAVIANLMNKLADARLTLNECLSTVAKDDEPARLEIADTLRQQIADTIGARLTRPVSRSCEGLRPSRPVRKPRASKRKNRPVYSRLA